MPDGGVADERRTVRYRRPRDSTPIETLNGTANVPLATPPALLDWLGRSSPI